jgi:hypothetical protein
MLDKAPQIDASRAARDLGMTPESYITPEQCVTDMAAALMQRGMVPRFSAPVVPLVLSCVMLVLALVGLAVVLLLRATGILVW